MAPSSNQMTKKFTEHAKQKKSRHLASNTNYLSHMDLDKLIKMSKEIEHATRKLRLQRSRSSTLADTMSQEDLFETTNIEDDRFLNAMEHETSYDAEKDYTDLVTSIENLIKYSEKDCNIKNKCFPKATHVKNITKRKVASAMASLRNKCGLASSPASKRKTQLVQIQAIMKEMQKIHETPAFIMESKTSSSTKILKSESPKLARKTKVKQMALLFNNKINAIIGNTTTTPHLVSRSMSSKVSPLITGNLKPKSPKMKAKFPNYVTKLPSPKPSPLLKRKQLYKSHSINSPINSPVTKRRQLQPPSTACLIADNIFSQLSVKDKALLYNKFIADLTKQTSNFGEHAKV